MKLFLVDTLRCFLQLFVFLLTGNAHFLYYFFSGYLISLYTDNYDGLDIRCYLFKCHIVIGCMSWNRHDNPRGYRWVSKNRRKNGYLPLNQWHRTGFS